MKFSRLFALLPFFALGFGVVNSVNAEQKAATQQAQEPTLAAFNKSVGIAAINRTLVQNEQGQQAINVQYVIENRGDKDIRGLVWSGVYLYNNQMLLMQDIPASFEQPLAPKEQMTVNAILPLNQIPQQIQPLFLDLGVNLSVTIVARGIEFADGTKLDVKN